MRRPSAEMAMWATNGAGVVRGSGGPNVFPLDSSIGTRHKLMGPPRPLTK